MRFGCVVNSLAGGRLGRRVLNALRDRQGSPEVEVFDLAERGVSGFLTNLDRFDRVLIAGGDGTVSTLLPHLLSRQVTVAILPLGTGNDLARELNVLSMAPLSHPWEWIAAYKRAATEQFSVWRAAFEGTDHEQLFINYLSFGLDGRIIENFDQARASMRWIPSLFGRFGNRLLYLREGLRQLRSEPITDVAIQMDVGGPVRSITVHRAFSLFFSNIHSAMGLGSSHSASQPRDQKIELSVLGGLTGFLQFLLPGLPGVPYQGYDGAENWRLENLPTWCGYQADGEYLGEISSSTVVISHAGWLTFCSNTNHASELEEKREALQQ